MTPAGLPCRVMTTSSLSAILRNLEKSSLTLESASRRICSIPLVSTIRPLRISELQPGSLLSFPTHHRRSAPRRHEVETEDGESILLRRGKQVRGVSPYKREGPPKWTALRLKT